MLSSPKTPAMFTYDADENMLSDGRFTYSWDCENRLISVETRTDLLAKVPRVKVEFGYDYMGRRIGKMVYEQKSKSKKQERWSLTSDISKGSGLVIRHYTETGAGRKMKACLRCQDTGNVNRGCESGMRLNLEHLSGVPESGVVSRRSALPALSTQARRYSPLEDTHKNT